MTLRLTTASPTRNAAVACAALALALIGAGLFASGSSAATLPTVSATVSPTSVVITGTVPSGAVNIATLGTSGKEPDLTLLLLKPGSTVQQAYSLFETNQASKDPNVVAQIGAIVFDNEAGKGKPSEAQTVLAPGTYVAINPEGEKSSKWPHTTFTVAASPSPAALPAAQATEKTIEFGFKGPSVLKTGELVRFENEGYLVHMDLAFGVKSRSAAQKVVKGLLTGNEKGLEKLVAGPPANFAGPLSTGSYQQEVITAKPGWYVQACFMQTQDGRPHTRLGMERIIKIVK
jgi:hypothetical protein